MNGDIDPAFGPAWDETRGEPTYAPDLPRLSLKAVSALVGRSRWTILGWLKNGSFPLRKVDGRYYWTAADVERLRAFIAERNRHHKFVSTLLKEVFDKLREDGRPLTTIAEAAGCSPKTLYNVRAGRAATVTTIENILQVCGYRLAIVKIEEGE